jgi:hypothetical protein
VHNGRAFVRQPQTLTLEVIRGKQARRATEADVKSEELPWDSDAPPLDLATANPTRLVESLPPLTPLTLRQEYQGNLELKNLECSVRSGSSLAVVFVLQYEVTWKSEANKSRRATSVALGSAVRLLNPATKGSPLDGQRQFICLQR